MEVPPPHDSQGHGTGLSLVVRHTHATDSFVALPAGAKDALLSLTGHSLPMVLQLTADGPAAHGTPAHASWYVAWMGGVASSGSHIEMPAVLGECLSLPEGTAIRVHARLKVPPAFRVCLEPLDADDWDATGVHADDIQDGVLQQAVVAAVGQAIPFWPPGAQPGGKPIRLRVTSAEPASVVRLVTDTELVVAPVVRHHHSDAKAAAVKPAQPLPSVVRVHPATPPPGASYEAQGTATPLRVKGTSFMTAFLDGARLTAAGLEPGALVRLTLLSGGLTHDPEEPGAPPPPPRLPHGALFRMLPLTGGDPQPLAGCGLHIALPRFSREALTAPPYARLKCTPLEESEVEGLSQPRRLTLCPLQPPSPAGANKQNGITGFAARSMGMAIAGAVTPGHKAALTAVGWDGRPPGSVPMTSAAMMRMARFHGGGGGGDDDDEEEENPEANGEAAEVVVDTNVAASRLMAAWLDAQLASSPQGVPLQDGTLVVFDLRGDTSGAVTFVLRCDPQECLIRPPAPGGTAADALANLPPVTLGPPLPRPFGKEGAEGTPWPPADAHLAAPNAGPARLVRSPAEADALATTALSWAPHIPATALARLRVVLSAPQREALKGLGTPVPGGVLIHGAPGMGRTALALGIAAALASSPDCCCYTATVSCAELAGEDPDTQHAALEALLAAARGRRPAVVVLDDLDALMPAQEASETPGAPPGMGGQEGALALAEFLADAMDALQPGGSAGPQGIAFLATASSPNAVAPQLRASGRLDLVLEIPPLDAKAREQLLVQAASSGGRLASTGVATGAALEAASATDGYDTADLNVLADRTILAAAGRLLAPPMQTGDQPRPLDAPDFAAGRQGLVPAALRGGGLTNAATGAATTRTGWEAIGGLSSVRAALDDALCLPTRFASLFAGAPLRLRTGALLYGPPGCGKSLVARAAAEQAGLRLIGVKGPELLNKYIGQSEAGVRSLFRKAAAAAPCVLFFDEFDAIAPRRGHDNTGVTDRVVNQLLTELDGIEALNGVAVLAATSRPDLLDPALLRPGRLDRMLHCGLPDSGERRAILYALAPGVGITAPESDTNMTAALDAAAANTHGCSGADLAALLSEAQLAAAKDALAAAEAQGEHVAAEVAVVTPGHVRVATATARPSVSAGELARLDAIYMEFLAGRAGGLGGGPRRAAGKGKRATLA